MNAGDYYVQGLLNIYETYHLANGQTVKLPPERGEGQQWNRKPGNLYSKPQKVRIDPAQGGVVYISLREKILPLDEPRDTKYIKHLKIKSELLTKFWGTPVYIGAIVYCLRDSTSILTHTIRSWSIRAISHTISPCRSQTSRQRPT